MMTPKTNPMISHPIFRQSSLLIWLELPKSLRSSLSYRSPSVSGNSVKIKTSTVLHQDPATQPHANLLSLIAHSVHNVPLPHIRIAIEILESLVRVSSLPMVQPLSKLGQIHSVFQFLSSSNCFETFQQSRSEQQANKHCTCTITFSPSGATIYGLTVFVDNQPAHRSSHRFESPQSRQQFAEKRPPDQNWKKTTTASIFTSSPISTALHLAWRSYQHNRLISSTFFQGAFFGHFRL